MAADASHIKPLKLRLLSVSPSEVYRLAGKCDISFDLPQKRATLFQARAQSSRKLDRSPNLDDARKGDQRRGLVGKGV
jgi:hypothetical protein